MARKTDILVITAEGRDKGKRFVLTEMPALKAERWATRALLALARSGAQLPEDVMGAGIAALAVASMQALRQVKFEDIDPLMAEMMTCVHIMPDPKNPEVVRPLVMNGAEGDDIEEIATLWEIRERVFKLHTDFFLAGQK